MNNTTQKVKLSALWAAYGDALGFMSELADESGLRHRTGETRVTRPVKWRRRIGGRFGPTVEMPAGAYSDDTQLRLAVGRAIRGDGKFDVEAFARVELPVWLSYALGAGLGTRAAANSLSRENVNWVTNFYEADEQSYLASGGNGAAMRIQPHVWTARDRKRAETFLPDVVRNAIVTHGHPRAILGAIFHALSIADALEYDAPPTPDQWRTYVEVFHKIPELIHADRELRDLWLPLWEQKTRGRLSTAFERVAAECVADVGAAKDLPRSDERAYREYVAGIGGTSREFRGSGTKTAITAAVLAWCFRDDVDRALLASANLLHSDTDSISSMAGAILGPSAGREPLGELQDRDYLTFEAKRLSGIGAGHEEATFPYPDLLKWRAPRTQSDAIASINGRFAVSGIGFAEPIEGTFAGKGKPTPIYQWFRLSFGQTVLLKRREEIGEMNEESLSRERTVSGPKSRGVEDASLFGSADPRSTRSPVNSTHEGRSRQADLHRLTREAIDSNFDPFLIGRHLLALSDGEDGIERCIAYAAIIAKARRSRSDARRIK